jgi:CheY-like chemotaxis protein
MPQTGIESHISDSDLRNMHILIVDDDTTMLDLIEALLQSMGVTQITRAQSGMEAFEKISKSQRVVDCVLCDYSMNQGNGLQLLQAVRMGQIKYFRRDACFILLTASGSPDTVVMAAELDVSGYLVKPVTPAKLRTAIAKARVRPIRINFQKYSQVFIPN